MLGPERTLDLRDSLLTSSQVERRVDTWCRERQLEFAGLIQVIAGRELSASAAYRDPQAAVLRTLRSLRRCGVVRLVEEDGAGAFTADLAPLSALLSAPARRVRSKARASDRRSGLHLLSHGTRSQLQLLAGMTLDSLGIGSPSVAAVDDEVERHLALLLRGTPAGADADAWISTAVGRLLIEQSNQVK